MNIQQFQYILAVVDLKNFESAADKCFVTQSTLSTMIGRFEDEIGVKLFNRKTKPVSITPEGEQIIQRLRIVLNEIDALKNVVQELKGEMVGNLKIGIIPTIAPYLLPLFLPEFASRFPAINISVREMTTAQIQQALHQRTIDLGILALPLHDEAMEEISLYKEPFMLYDCTENTCKNKQSISNLNYSKLCLLQEGHCLRTQVQQICDLSSQFARNDVNYEFESGSMDSLLRITKARKGITIIPYLAVLEMDTNEKNKIIEFENPVPVRSVGLITHKFFVKKRLLRELQEIIQSAVKDLIPKTENSTLLEPQ